MGGTEDTVPAKEVSEETLDNCSPLEQCLNSERSEDLLSSLQGTFFMHLDFSDRVSLRVNLFCRKILLDQVLFNLRQL